MLCFAQQFIESRRKNALASKHFYLWYNIFVEFCKKGSKKMKVKEKRFKYDNYYVCKADLNSLNEIDNKLGSLSERMEASVDMLNNELLEENHKRQLNRFINTTYPNSKSALIEKRKNILSKYKPIKSIENKKRLLILLFIIIFIFVVLFIGNTLDAKIKEERMAQKLVYVSSATKTYHFDDYCTKLSSLDKKEKITLQTAINRDYKACRACCK